MEGKVSMKRVLKIVLFAVIASFSTFLIGCSLEKTRVDEEAPAFLKEITGDVLKATVNSDGDIVIDKSEVNDEVRYYSYEYNGVTIGLLAVRDSSGDVKVVVNTCQSCQGSPYAYFVQVGDSIQCQNCGSVFEIDKLDELETGGCNPIGIKEKQDDGEKITISHWEIESYKDKFENWKGPKA